MFMICSTNGTAVITAAALSVPLFHPCSASQVTPITSPALRMKSVDHM